ncbi:asparagine synthase C-terminal domain-containing protein [Maribacter litoralis]|uniref:asparagine synthase C-terminal domain-containing protein n=1 Tax=Maribacter litoralis TaxID=2059726 RepID=UPI000E30BB76|nr:asparagine synthase C-terminal domain-containing protein [Maribacter litoralis]
MDVNILLTDQNSFKWSVNQNIYVLGFLFDSENRILRDDDFLTYCENIKDLDTFKNKILEQRGNFAVIIKTKNDVFMAVDSIRTFPLFYLEKDNSFFVSDSSDYLQKTHCLSFDKTAEHEFLATGYVTKDHTLLTGLFQLQAGEFIQYSLSKGLLRKEYYTDYLTHEINLEEDYGVYKKKLATVLENALDRMLNFVDGKPILVPLSGGYDSRLIVCMLKKRGVENVICYTYGATNSHEVIISKKVAESLNYKWLFIEYNENTIPHDYLTDPDFQSYYKYASNHSSVFLLQDYFAVKQLKEKELVPNNCIILPGHSADFLAGSHLSLTDIKNDNRENTIRRIFDKHYNLNKPVQFSQENNDYLKQISCKFEYAVDENWNLKERQAKFIVNSVRIYEFFGFEHYLIFWDREIQEYFKTLPVEYKHRTKLYLKLIFEDYFNPLSVEYLKEKSEIKDLLKKMLPNKIKEKLRKKLASDFNKFDLMKKPLKIQGDEVDTNINSYIAKWYLQQITL